MQERCQDSGHATAEALRWCGRGEYREPWTGLQMALETLLLEIRPSFQCLEPQQSCSASPTPELKVLPSVPDLDKAAWLLLPPLLPGGKQEMVQQAVKHKKSLILMKKNATATSA